MRNREYILFSLFEKASFDRQLSLLAAEVLASASAGGVIQQDVEAFDKRLEKYAARAGITRERARGNVSMRVYKMLRNSLHSHGIHTDRDWEGR